MKSLFDSTGGVEMYDSTIHVHKVNLDKVSTTIMNQKMDLTKVKVY